MFEFSKFLIKTEFFSGAKKARASSVDASHNNVITCPLSGGQPSAQNYGQNGYADYNAPPTSYQGTVFTPPQNPSIIPTMAPQQIGGLNAGHQPTFQTQLPSQPQFNTMQSQSYGGPPSSLPDQTAANVTRIASPEPKAKAPIPEEYVYLQTVFNELKTQCINTATNPVSECTLHIYLKVRSEDAVIYNFVCFAANQTKIR